MMNDDYYKPSGLPPTRSWTLGLCSGAILGGRYGYDKSLGLSWAVKGGESGWASSRHMGYGSEGRLIYFTYDQ